MTLHVAKAENQLLNLSWKPWFIWLVSSLFVTYQMLLQTAPSVMILDLENAFSINAFNVSLLSSSFYYTYVLLQIPAGILVDRFSPRVCLSFCLLGIVCTCVIFANATTLSEATMSRIIQGIFSAPSVVPALLLASVWFSSKQFALLAGLTEMVGVLGSAIAQVTLAPCSSYFGWRHTYWICAAVGLALAFFAWLIIQNKPRTESSLTIKPNRLSVFNSLGAVISYPQAWINGLFSGLLFAVSAAFGGFWCIPFLMLNYSVSLTQAATASSMVLFGVALGAPFMGWLSDKIGLRRLPMVVSTTLVTLLMLIIIFVPHIYFSFMFILLFCLGFFSGVYALPFAVMRDIMPSNVRGTALGYTNMMSILIGSPILQPLIGWIISRQVAAGIPKSLAYHHALGVLPTCLIVALILTVFLKETFCNNTEERT